MKRRKELLRGTQRLPFILQTSQLIQRHLINWFILLFFCLLSSGTAFHLWIDAPTPVSLITMEERNGAADDRGENLPALHVKDTLLRQRSSVGGEVRTPPAVSHRAEFSLLHKHHWDANLIDFNGGKKTLHWEKLLLGWARSTLLTEDLWGKVILNWRGVTAVFPSAAYTFPNVIEYVVSSLPGSLLLFAPSTTILCY